jgi:RNA recognition motif-containing protein
VNPRTNRPVGYAFVDLATASEATAALENLSGKEILARKVSVQLARKPEPAEAKEGAASGGEGASGNEGRKRTGGRGRGRGRARGRGGRTSRGRVCKPLALIASMTRLSLRHSNMIADWSAYLQAQDGQEANEANASEAAPLTETTNETEPAAAEGALQGKPRAPRPQKQRGPPEDGIPSKTKVMVANLPYDLTEDKVRAWFEARARLGVVSSVV